MKVSYGFVFFIAIGMAAATVLLLTLSIRPVRNVVMGFVKKYGIGQGSTYYFIFWFSFTLVTAIMVDAIWSYMSMRAVLSLGTHCSELRGEGYVAGQLRHDQGRPTH